MKKFMSEEDLVKIILDIRSGLMVREAAEKYGYKATNIARHLTVLRKKGVDIPKNRANGIDYDEVIKALKLRKTTKKIQNR